MTKKEAYGLYHKYEYEGFEYAISNYSSDIVDDKFIELKKKFLATEKELHDYCNDEWTRHGTIEDYEDGNRPE